MRRTALRPPPIMPMPIKSIAQLAGSGTAATLTPPMTAPKGVPLSPLVKESVVGPVAIKSKGTVRVKSILAFQQAAARETSLFLLRNSRGGRRALTPKSDYTQLL